MSGVHNHARAYVVCQQCEADAALHLPTLTKVLARLREAEQIDARMGYRLGGESALYVALAGLEEVAALARTLDAAGSSGDDSSRGPHADGHPAASNGPESGSVHVADVVAYAVIAACALLFLYSAARFCGVTA